VHCEEGTCRGRSGTVKSRLQPSWHGSGRGKEKGVVPFALVGAATLGGVRIAEE
jgi:hypothetical protein